MSVGFSPRKEALAEDKVLLNILLNCEQTKSSETKQVHFQSLPTTPLEIKKKIEEDFSIPLCVQTLHYQSMILKDSDELQHTHFRSGDTFSVDYQTRGDCERIQNVIQWLKEILGYLQDIEDNDSHADGEKDPSLSSYLCNMVEDLILSGMHNGTAQDLCLHLFYPWKDKRTYMNKLHFHHEGGLEVLMKVYGQMVSKEWGGMGIDSQFHLYLECLCSQAVANYTQTFPLRRQVIQLGGLDMCTKTLLRKQVVRDSGGEIVPDTLMKSSLEIALYAVCNLSELPECQVPLSMRTDVIDQTLGIALHPAYDSKTAIVSASMILCLVQSPEAHVYIARKEVVENMLEMCELKHKMVDEPSSQSQQGEKEDPMAVNALKGYTSIVLAQIGLGSPHLLFDSIPPHLQLQILNLMSDMLEAASPAEIRLYEEKEGLVWGTFLPYLRYLYKPSNLKNVTAENSDGDIRTNFHISCCNVLLHGLENALGRDLHLEVLIKEGLLDYTMCLPAVLPGECQPRARSLVNELGRHRQLQPPSLCTLAKAHIAKTFCGLQAVMEMNSIGEFVHKCFS